MFKINYIISSIANAGCLTFSKNSNTPSESSAIDSEGKSSGCTGVAGTSGNLRSSPCDPRNEVGGALVLMEHMSPGVGGTMVYLNVNGELDAVLSRIESAGGKIIRPKFSIGEFGWVTLCEDTQGNMFGLSSMK